METITAYETGRHCPECDDEDATFALVSDDDEDREFYRCEGCGSEEDY